MLQFLGKDIQYNKDRQKTNWGAIIQQGRKR